MFLFFSSYSCSYLLIKKNNILLCDDCCVSLYWLSQHVDENECVSLFTVFQCRYINQARPIILLFYWAPSRIDIWKDTRWTPSGVRRHSRCTHTVINLASNSPTVLFIILYIKKSSTNFIFCIVQNWCAICCTSKDLNW